MKEIVGALANPLWWFSVVIAGLLINVLAAYLKGFADRLLARYFDTARRGAQEAEVARNGRILELVNDKDALSLAHFAEIRNRLRALNSLLLAATVMLMGTLVGALPVERLFSLTFQLGCLAGGPFLTALGANSFREAVRQLQEIREA